MIAYLILTALILSAGWFLCVTLRSVAHDAVIRSRIAEIGEDSKRHVAHGEWFAVPAVKAPDLHSTANRTGALR